MSSSRKILLKSVDGQDLKIEEAAAKLSEKIKNIIDNDRSKTVFLLRNVSGGILSMIIEYCRMHVAQKENVESLKLFDRQFVNEVDEVTLLYLRDAASNLEIKCLYDLCDESLNAMLKAKLEAKTLHEIIGWFGREDVNPVASNLISVVLRLLAQSPS